MWFRREIEVPQTLNGYDLTGARIWFQFRANANGPMPEIIYFNGRRVALGDDLEPIVLFDNAKPGDKVLVAVKLLPTVDEKRIAGVDLKIDFATEPAQPGRSAHGVPVRRAADPVAVEGCLRRPGDAGKGDRRCRMCLRSTRTIRRSSTHRSRQRSNARGAEADAAAGRPST